MFIIFILLTSLITTPVRIAFAPINEPAGWQFFEGLIDIMFLLDILVIFNSAFYDNEFFIVQNRKIIANEYLKSWFTIDLLSIIPLEDFLL